MCMAGKQSNEPTQILHFHNACRYLSNRNSFYIRIHQNLRFFNINRHFISCEKSSGPALGIGRECDGLGPMPVGGPKFFFTRGVYIARSGFWGVSVVKYTNRQARRIDMED